MNASLEPENILSAESVKYDVSNAEILLRVEEKTERDLKILMCFLALAFFIMLVIH